MRGQGWMLQEAYAYNCCGCLQAIIHGTGCDKNMPGTLIAMARLNRPSLMIYGGTIKPGHGSLGNNQTLDIVSAFQSYGTPYRTVCVFG